MCLDIKKTKNNKALYEIAKKKIASRRKYKDSVMKLAIVATSDIPVFKILKCDLDGNLSAPHRGMNYEMGKVISAALALFGPYHYNNISIGAGMHSLKTVYAVNKHKSQHISMGTTVTLDAIVPKGSSYFVGYKGDIVSSSLKILDSEENRDKIKKFIENNS